LNHFSASTALYFPQGYSERLYAIHNSRVTNDLRDTTLYNFLVIPSEVNYVNFTWKSGRRKYFYDFDSFPRGRFADKFGVGFRSCCPMIPEHNLRESEPFESLDDVIISK